MFKDKKSFLLILTSMLFPIFLKVNQAKAISIENELAPPKSNPETRESIPDTKIEYGSIRVGNEIQRIILTIPKIKKEKFPALMFIGGMGCYSIDFSGDNGLYLLAYKSTIDLAAKLGFVTLRVEKSGMGDSQGTPCENQSFLREFQGNLSGLKMLKKLPFVDAENIYLFGHSIGGIEAPMLAAEVPVKSIASLGTLAGTWSNYWNVNNKRQFILAGDSGAQLQENIDNVKLMTEEFFIKKKNPETILREYPKLKPYLSFPVDWKYIQEVEDINMKDLYLKSSARVTIFSANSDFVGSQYSEIKESVQEINLERLSNPIQIIQIPNLDHFFRNATTQEESYQSKHSDGTRLSLNFNFYEIFAREFLLK